MDQVDFKTLIDMFNSENILDVNLAEEIFVNFTDDELDEFYKWGWKNGYSSLFRPTPKTNERFWKRTEKSKRI